MTLREHLTHLDIDLLVRQCTHRTKVDEDTTKDIVYGTIAKMLAQESRFDGQFENILALHAYISVTTIREIYRITKGKYATSADDHIYTVADTNEDPEQSVINKFERQSMEQVLQNVLAKYTATHGVAKDMRKLIQLFKTTDAYISVRQSGQNKGMWVFDITALMKKLKWNRHKVSSHLERLRKDILVELKSNEKEKHMSFQTTILFLFIF